MSERARVSEGVRTTVLASRVKRWDALRVQTNVKLSAVKCVLRGNFRIVFLFYPGLILLRSNYGNKQQVGVSLCFFRHLCQDYCSYLVKAVDAACVFFLVKKNQ